MADFYVDSKAAGGGSGSLANPWNSFGQWSNAAPGSRIIFRGGDHQGGGIYSPKNFTLKAYADEFVRFTDTGAGGSLLTLEVWTDGFIDATEGGITFGPGNPNKPDDGAYWKGTLQLTGCSGLLLDGGPERLLRFAGNSDIGLYLVDYPGGGHGDARGCRDVIVQNFETTELATGVLVRSSGKAEKAPLGGQGVILQDFEAHHHQLMLDNRGQGSDAGAVGFTLYACEGTIARRFTAHDNYAASKDYGFDGGAFEVFAARDYVIEDFAAWDNEGGIETGRNGDLPLGTNGIIRRGYVHGTSNMGNQDPPRSPDRAAARLRGRPAHRLHLRDRRHQRARRAVQRLGPVRGLASSAPSSPTTPSACARTATARSSGSPVGTLLSPPAQTPRPSTATATTGPTAAPSSATTQDRTASAA